MLEVLDGLQLNQEVSVEAELLKLDPLDGHSYASVVVLRQLMLSIT